MRIRSLMWIMAGTMAGLGLAKAAAATPARQAVCLNGVWEFQWGRPGDATVPKGRWGTIPVPGSIAPTGTALLDIADPPAEAYRGWYRRTFFVPADWSDGRRVKLNFQGIDWAHEVFVNGKSVASSPYFRLCFDVDITAQVCFGQRNTLTVWVDNVQKANQGPEYLGRHEEIGIIRSVYLTSVPPLHMEHNHVVTSVQKKTITVKTLVRNETDRERTARVHWRVLDNGQTVLSLPDKTIKVPAAGSMEVETAMAWSDPVLWGFGQYGRPHLYYLRGTLEGGPATDVTFDRFGFREFNSKGPDFLLNGKPISIKGDLLTRAWSFTEHPNFLTAFYQAMRSANLNFERLHSSSTDNFESSYWYEVADELGHLVEAQCESSFRQVDHSYNLQQWTAYVNAHFNNPSLVMWCGDNERLSVPLPIENCVNSITPENAAAFNRLAGHVRKLDPSRVFTYAHGYALWAGIDAGLYDRANYMTFDIHPYGSVCDQISRARKTLGFDGSVPYFVSETADFAAALDLVNDPVGSFVELRRRGRAFADQAVDLVNHRMGNSVMCALINGGFLGYTGPSYAELKVGPWSQDRLVWDNATAKPTFQGVRECLVKVRWPSMSGEGVKTEYLMPSGAMIGANDGYGMNFNWFDRTRPAFYPSIKHQLAREAYGRVDRTAEPPLGPERANDVVVCFGLNGKPVEGAYVQLIPEGTQAPPVAAVATDPDGTAWFHFWDTGRYRAQVSCEGKTYARSFDISHRPPLTAAAGYDHLVWVDLNGIDIGKRKQELARTAEFTDSTIRRAGESILNGDMEYWHKGKLQYWPGGGAAIPETKIKRSGKYSIKLQGPSTAITGIFQDYLFRPLKKGHRYKVSGWICKGAGSGCGSLSIKTGGYASLVTLTAGKTVGQWEHVEADYTADGTETYFYCLNASTDPQATFYYDDVSVRELTAGPTAALNPGPFPVTKAGYITHWLTCGPFPNVGRPTEKGLIQLGHRTDWLGALGGEATARPKFGQAVTATFPPDGAWLEGTDQVTWRDLHAADSPVSLAGVTLPSRGITANPPSMVDAYVFCFVDSPEDRQALLALGSDDGNTAWLNGKRVGDVETFRGYTADQEKYPVSLKKGSNRLLIKVDQGTQDWLVSARFLTRAGQPMTDLTVRLTE